MSKDDESRSTYSPAQHKRKGKNLDLQILIHFIHNNVQIVKMKIAVLLFCAIAEETSTLILKEALAETCLIDERSHRSQFVLVRKYEPAIAIPLAHSQRSTLSRACKI